MCLVCGATLSILKAFNVKRHYNALYQDRYDKTVGKLREDLVKKLRNFLCVQQCVFSKKVSCYSKPFIREGEFPRECNQDVAKLMVPKQANLFKKGSLSRTAIANSIEEIGENIFEQLQLKAGTFEYFSLAFDETCDLNDTAQISVFIRAVAKDLSTHEDLVGLIPFNDAKRGISMKEGVVNALYSKIPN